MMLDQQANSGRRVRSNLIANYSGTLWSIASVYLFVPLYIKFLGVAAYGVIAFNSALLGVLFIADAGLSSAFAREIAKHRGEKAELATLLKSLECIYLAIFLAAAASIGLASGWITVNWLKPSSQLSPLMIRTCIILMGISSAIQVSMSLFIGGLMGADRHATANGLQIGFSMVRSGLVVLPLYFWPDLRVYFAWQLASGFVFLLLMRHSVWRNLRPVAPVRFSSKALHKIGGFAAGMLLISIISSLNSQMDKLVLSKMLGLQDLARYSIAGLLAQVPSIITLPIAVSLLPRLTRWADIGRLDLVADTYHRFSFVIASIGGIAGLAIALSPARWVYLWTHNIDLSNGIGLTVWILTSGNVLLAIQYMPYHLAIANGHSRTNVIIGMSFLVITPFLLVILIRRLGISGAAIPWLFLNAGAAVLLATILTRRFLPGQLGRWWTTGCIAPLAVIAFDALIVQWIWSAFAFSPSTWIWKTIVATLTCSCTCFAVYVILFMRPYIDSGHLTRIPGMFLR